MFDPHGTELSGERGTSTAFSGEGEKLLSFKISTICKEIAYIA